MQVLFLFHIVLDVVDPSDILTIYSNHIENRFMKKMLSVVLLLLSLTVYSANIPLYIGESYTIPTPDPVAGGYICNVICTERSNNLIVVKNDDYSITVIPAAYSSSTSIVKLKFYETFWGEYSKRNEIIDHNETTYTFTTQYPKIEIPTGENNITIELGETRQLKYKMTPSNLMTPPMNFGYNMMDLPCVNLSEDDKGFVTGTSVGKCRIMAIPYNNNNMTLQWTITVVDSDPNKIKLMADPAGGEVELGTDVSLRTPNVSGTEKYYTLDGSTPSKSSMKYGYGITINNTCTLKAIAYKDGYITSDVLTANYIVQQEKLTLNAETTGGEVSAGTVIKLTPSVSDAKIYYTLDGSKPTQGSTLYTSTGITVNESCTLKAIAYKDGYNPSDVLTETYIVELTKIQLSASPSDGEIIAGTKVTLTTSNVEGADIYYTLDGSSPTTSSTQYTSSGISIDKECTLKAIAVKEGYKESDVLTATYSVKVPITNILLSDTLLALGKNNGKYVYATIAPNNTTCTDFIWTSSNPDVATVYEKGTKTEDGTYRNYISAKALGSTTITCTANDGSGVYAMCTVNVYTHGDNAYFSANTVEGAEIRYYVDNAASGTCEVYSLSYKNYYGTITIPSVIDGFRVTSISRYAFSSSSITNINIPSSLERIEESAFRDCKYLSSIALDNVKYLGRCVFIGCSSLSKITGINNLEYIGSYAFHSSSNGDNAIPWYNKLPDGILYLGKVLYKYKGKIPENTEISVKEGIVSISAQAFFDGGNNLESIALPKSLSDISVESFYNCYNLKRILVAEGNEKYDSRENSNAIIEKGTNTLIYGCIGTTIPNSIDSIGDEAFYQSKITNVHIGSGVRKLGKDVFRGCSYLDSISVSEANPYFDSRENCNAIIESKTNRLVVGCHNTKIPFTVKTIGSYAFYTSTSKLKTIRIHDNIETIEDYAFYNQYALTSVTFDRGMKKIGQYAFAYCSNLKCVHSLLELPTAFDETVFLGRWNSTTQKYDFSKATLYVPKGTTINYMTTEGWLYFEKIVEIDDDALMEGEKFTDETIDGIELTYEVKDTKDKTCELVESPTTIEGKVTIPDAPKGYSVVSIGTYAFYGYNTERRITEVFIPEGVKDIGIRAFAENGTIESVDLPNSVRNIGSYAFYSNKLTSLVIPNSVDSISYGAFSSNSLESLTIGSSLRKLVDNAFRYNNKLRSIEVAANNPYFDSRSNCNAIIEKSTNKLVTGCLSTEIPSSVKAIGDYAFTNYDYSYSLTLSDNIESIGKYAFRSNYSVRSLTIGKKVKEIDSYAFNSCYNLRAVHVLNVNPITIEESVFNGSGESIDSIYNNATLYVPIGAKSKYVANTVWKKFKKIVETDGQTPCEGDIIEPADCPLIFAITNSVDKSCEVIGAKSTAAGNISIPTEVNDFSVKGIGNRAFYQKKGITHIEIPASITYLSDYAFQYCSDLESMVLPSSLERIGNYALGGLVKVRNMIIPKSVNDIGRGILTADSLLVSITVEDGNPVYDSRGDCNAIIEHATNKLIAGCNTTVIPSSVEAIGNYAFSSLSLEIVDIPNSIKTIGSYAFYNNKALKKIVLPSSVDSIGDNAFRLCVNLRYIYSLNKTPHAINEGVFKSTATDDVDRFLTSTLYVPYGTKSIYHSTDGWKNFVNIVETNYIPSLAIKGDVNCDGEVNGTDYVALTNIIDGKNAKSESADVNGDGEVNVIDYVALVNIILDRYQTTRKANSSGSTNLSIDPSFKIKAGEEKELLVNLTNPNDLITLVQFNLRLPAGLSLKQTDGRYDINITNRTTEKKHSLVASKMNDVVNFLLSSNSNKSFSGTEGAVIKMTINADDNFTSGDIQLENILMISTDSKETRQGIYVYNINTTEPPIPETSLLDFVTFDVDDDGDTELVIGLYNPEDEITLVQFDLSLPSGLTLKQNEDGYNIDIAGRTTWDRHWLDANATNGVIRLLLASANNAILSGTEGAVIKMAVKTDDSFNSGTVTLDNILLVTPIEKGIKPSAISFAIDPIGVNVISADSSDRNAIYNLSGQRVATPCKGINIIRKSDGTTQKVLIK